MKVMEDTAIERTSQNDVLTHWNYTDGMAAVLGHEIAHQLARHSGEKLSFVKILFVLQVTLTLFGIDPSFIFNQLMLNFGIMMPFSRKCETEADSIGLQLMAQACFDPNEATRVWQRMEASGGREAPQFASTHPSHKNRVQRLEKEVCRVCQALLTTISTDWLQIIDAKRSLTARFKWL